MDRDLALHILRGALPALSEEFAISRLSLFGSTARDEAGADSDVDVLVEFSQTPDYFQFIRLRDRLSALLGRPVDLATERALRASMKTAIYADLIHA